MRGQGSRAHPRRARSRDQRSPLHGAVKLAAQEQARAGLCPLPRYAAHYRYRGVAASRGSNARSLVIGSSSATDAKGKRRVISEMGFGHDHTADLRRLSRRAITAL
jgi:hypothetical protein